MPAMPTTAQRDILALQPALLTSAMAMSRDQNEAHELVHLTVVKAMECPGDQKDLDTRIWMFGLMRSVFHSVERRRVARRERGFTLAPQARAEGRR